MGVDDPVADSTNEPANESGDAHERTGSELPALVLPHIPNVGAALPTKRTNKPTSAHRPVTPATNNERAPTPTLPLLTPSTSGAPTTRANAKFQCKLTPLQLAAILKPFWADVLANQQKTVRKHLVEHHLKKIDFNAATIRYAPYADATPVHLCAQFGFLAMAKMLVLEFGLTATVRNKVGQTPFHVACKFGQHEVVRWLIDELHVPLDVPDGQHRIALDIAPFDVVDKCVLMPLRIQYHDLQLRESALMEANRDAEARLANAELAFRQQSMLLCDTESHLSELRTQLIDDQSVASHWLEEWQIRNTVLAEQAAAYEKLQQDLANEQQRAHDLFDQEVRAVQEENRQAHNELEELQALVATTQRELDRRRQLLVDQLGVFDAALCEFGGSKDVQQWVMATLLAIAREEGGEVDRTELLLRAEPIDVVRHLLTAFPRDHELQDEALELLVTVLRLHRSYRDRSSDAFIAAIADSELLLQLGDVLARWFGAPETAISANIIVKTLEALYLCLAMRRNTQRVVAFCQHKNIHLSALHIITEASSRSQPSAQDRCLLRHATFLLLTQTKYGTKKVLLKAGVVRTAFETLQRLSRLAASSPDDPEAETVQYLFATLALLTSSFSSSESSRSDRLGKCREPTRLEDLTADTEFISAGVMIDCVRLCVLPNVDVPATVTALLWAFKLLTNLAEHGGETAQGVRHDLLDEVVLSADQDPLVVLVQGINAALNISTIENVNGQSTQTVLAGLELLRIVWIERFNHEGRIVPTRLDAISALPGMLAPLTHRLLVPTFENAATILVDVATAIRSVAAAAQNPKNATILASHDVKIDRDVLKPILAWTVHFVEETGTSYREPNLVMLLSRVLKLFLLLTDARYRERVAFLQTATASDVAGFYRLLHGQSHDTGVCAVLRVFRDFDQVERSHTSPPEWTALRALCVQIQERTHCSC